MRSTFPILLRDFLLAFVALFLVFTLLRYFGWLNFTGTRGDLIASMRAEILPSLLWGLAYAALRVMRKR
ncbi:hypothetical protein [Deinococcus yavapaiensis]|uniref:Uncharacterized protein n=1 Tax=Deinococcus yavapaiensis KR-236 TaxID=694435 RepID=A0A318S6E5_9DEIO|nr:hypothetical protein [Deinococcus yavapaiensis]PYE54243.1 hypothetical protein DES52_106209 [Deinococcus yavapaiensis KR-236]